MTCPEDRWESVLGSRYCRNSPLMLILSEKNKTLVWRQLWIWLAEAEMQLGLPQVTSTAIEQMKEVKEKINWTELREEERKVKHDVMAHNHVYGRLCPSAAGIIHLGATSCYIQDNADCIIIRQSVDHILERLALCLSRLADFAENTKSEVTIGRTHYQIEQFRNDMRFRGIKGATGTQDSFMTLFKGDEDKVDELNSLVTKKAGFDRCFSITGQTYTRMQDVQLVSALAAFAAAAKKMCTDIRMLQAFEEMWEPFEESQIGSSAMPYKKNPMKSERVCALARILIGLPQAALNTLAEQGLERTLDDSAARRTFIGEALLNTDAIILILQNIAEGLRIRPDKMRMHVKAEMPFLGLEKALMFLTEHGADRQKAHAIIRSTALAAKEKEGEVDMKEMLADPFFDPVRDKVVELAASPISFIGRSVSQTEKFLREELNPSITPYLKGQGQKVQLDV